MKTDEELKTLAADINSGKVFCDRQIQSTDLNATFVQIFNIPKYLHTQTEEQIDEFSNSCGMVYEYFKEANLETFDGYPTFKSLKWLTKDELKKLHDFWGELRGATTKLDERIDSALAVPRGVTEQ